MLLAEFEVFHSRPIAPTRRVALGDSWLPCDPVPGFGGLLLGGVAARFAPEIDAELLPDLVALTHELEAGRRIPQPRLRHRLQHDRIGLTRSVHRLHRRADQLRFSFTDDKGAPGQHVLAAVYAAGRVERPRRGEILAAVRRGLTWNGEVGPALIGRLTARGEVESMSAALFDDPVGWAIDVLGLPTPDRRPLRSAVQRRFREALRDAHPDHGGDHDAAARRIADISEARRILLAS